MLRHAFMRSGPALLPAYWCGFPLVFFEKVSYGSREAVLGLRCMPGGVPGIQQRLSRPERAQKKEKSMRKKSHISLARFLVAQTNTEKLQQHRKAFYLGSILPDCKPSFLTERHEFYGTFDKVSDNIRSLLDSAQVNAQDGTAFWRHLGEIIHYIADYFTFPHNRSYRGTIRQHCAYEKELRDYLREYIASGRAALQRVGEKIFADADALLEYIRKAHEEYTRGIHTIEEDVRYIVRLCRQVIFTVVQFVCAGPAGAAA